VIRTEKEQSFAHYGTPRRSGRYPWGSGGDPANTRNRSFLDTVAMLRKQGMSEAEIAKGFGITTTQLRAQKSSERAKKKQEDILTAERLREKGWSHQAIGERMGGIPESSVRALLAPGAKDKADNLQTISNMLKGQVDKKKYIDVGRGVEYQIGITKSKLATAVEVLKEQGYAVHTIYIPQLSAPGKWTNTKVLAPPGTPLAEVNKNRAQIKQITDYSTDNGRSFLGIQTPISVSSRKIAINYPENGGDKADGVIYVRPGVKHLSLGSNRYSQVRIAVDGTHYLKGMAIYKEDLPDGVDLVFNTSKPNTGRKKDAMKPLKEDPDNPFGSVVRQIHDKNGKVSSAMNLVNEEGKWETWSKNLPSQMLSKQSPDLAKQQLNLTYERRLKEFNEINALTNPVVRRDLLLKFADSTDAASVHLKAANMKRQTTKVLMPIPSMKETEIYAPTFRQGERVVLIRFPHGGTFEIPQLTVNNRNREARRLLGTNPQDAVGINHKTAKHLSGADFDGDTVLVIPNPTRGGVKRTPPLEALKDFDAHVYKIPKGSPIKVMNDSQKQHEMGNISNLITDMTIGGANTEERGRAVRHSMVVIDAQNHELDWKQSEKDFGIRGLKEKYQGGPKAGAATLISRARAQTHVPEKRLRSDARGGKIDPKTGKLVWEQTGRMVPVGKSKRDPVTGEREYVETGRMKLKTQKSERLAETDDAFSLITPPGTLMEGIYAEHSNRLKAMANTARKEAVHTKPIPYSPSAKKAYSNEVTSLNSKLAVAERNAPYERQAQLLGNAAVSQKRQANPHMEPEEVKKIKQLALNEYRNRTRPEGYKKTKMDITQSEWNAIQAGAISTDKLRRILKNSDAETIKRLAMPKHKPKMTSTMTRRAQSMLASGATQAEVADALGIGLTTLKLGLSE
jgi:uncharacterized protein (DUF433 family)